MYQYLYMGALLIGRGGYVPVFVYGAYGLRCLPSFEIDLL